MLCKIYGDDKMEKFDPKYIENDFDILFGIKFCVKDIVSCSVTADKLKYNENYIVTVSNNPNTKAVNQSFMLNKNISRLKDKLTQ